MRCCHLTTAISAVNGVSHLLASFKLVRKNNHLNQAAENQNSGIDVAEKATWSSHQNSGVEDLSGGNKSGNQSVTMVRAEGTGARTH